jgi:hypothetical protein
VPGPSERTKIAQQVVAAACGGMVVAARGLGHNVIAGNGTRYQVRATVRNEKSGVISTVRFPNDASYLEHDKFVYVEFSPAGFPVGGWTIDSPILRANIANDQKGHQIETLLRSKGVDVTGELVFAYRKLENG